MSTLLYSDLSVAPEPADLTSLFDRATHVSVEPQPDLKNGKPRRITLLRNITFAGGYFADKDAACACAQLDLYKFGNEAYTRCAEHGVQDIGPLHRIYPARVTTRKAARR